MYIYMYAENDLHICVGNFVFYIFSALTDLFGLDFIDNKSDKRY